MYHIGLCQHFVLLEGRGLTYRELWLSIKNNTRNEVDAPTNVGKRVTSNIAKLTNACIQRYTIDSVFWLAQMMYAMTLCKFPPFVKHNIISDGLTNGWSICQWLYLASEGSVTVNLHTQSFVPWPCLSLHTVIPLTVCLLLRPALPHRHRVVSLIWWWKQVELCIRMRLNNTSTIAVTQGP